MAKTKVVTKVAKIDAAVCQTLRPEIKAALASVGAQYGLVFDLGGITYGDKNFKTSLKATLAGVDVEREAYIERAKWSAPTPRGELKLEWLDKSFTAEGKTFTVTGLKSSARSMPVRLACSDGKAHYGSVRFVGSHLTPKPTDSEIEAKLAEMAQKNGGQVYPYTVACKFPYIGENPIALMMRFGYVGKPVKGEGIEYRKS